MPTPGVLHRLAAASPDQVLAAIATVGDDRPVAVVATDIDFFKELNDEAGREAGDAVLTSFQRTLSGSLPNGSAIVRVGGDEWVAVIPDSSAETALILCEEIRAHWTTHYPSPEVSRRLGVSFGIAARPPHADTPEELFRAARAALDRAKREGRNRSAIYVEEKMVLKTNYYPRGTLDRLSKLSAAAGRTEASLLREALDDLLEKYRAET